MARSAKVFLNKQCVGIISEIPLGFEFRYDSDYINSIGAKAISLTLPLTLKPYTADHLFPFFCGLLSEGANKAVQCRTYKIDENDHFGLLLKTAGSDTIGAVTVKPISES
jgi:HipA-like protein